MTAAYKGGSLFCILIVIKFLDNRPVVWYKYLVSYHKGVWSSGMTGVSKTLSGSSILSAPVLLLRSKRRIYAVFGRFNLSDNSKGNQRGNQSKRHDLLDKINLVRIWHDIVMIILLSGWYLFVPCLFLHQSIVRVTGQ